MLRPNKILKNVADRLANVLASERASDVLPLLAQLDLSSISRQPTDSAPMETDARIGIWERHIKNREVVYTRVMGTEPWSLWAEVGLFRVRPGMKRVVFLGESVARGFFYDPHFNPAMALKSILLSYCESNSIEIIDLARISIDAVHLLELCKKSLTLDPAAIVIFAGNNWHPMLNAGQSEMIEVVHLLRQSGDWRSVKDFVEQKLRNQVRNFVERVTDLVRERRIPVVLVIPEFNLVEWTEQNPPPLLFDSTENSEWITLRSTLRTAVQRENIPQIIGTAQQMIALDGGTSPEPLKILADIALRENDHGTARKLLERVKDACVSSPLPWFPSPRCYSVIQEVLRHESARQEIAVVDLPSLFEQHLNGQLPDRRIFHDYCHLTAEGIRVAMAGVASILQPLLGGPKISQQRLFECVKNPSASIMSEAYFLAAVYNAKFGQPANIVAYHCAEALRYSPVVLETMRLYLDSHVRCEPTALCGSFDYLIEMHSLSAMNVLFSDPLSQKTLNLSLIEGMMKAQAAVLPETDELLKIEHGLEKTQIDMLDCRYCSMSSAALEAEWQDRTAFYQAFDNCSKFIFVARGSTAVKLQLNYRTENSESSALVLVTVNDIQVATLSASKCWVYQTFTIPEQVVLEGVNTILIYWPLPNWRKQERIEKVANILELSFDRKGAVDIYAVYADVYSFTASLQL